MSRKDCKWILVNIRRIKQHIKTAATRKLSNVASLILNNKSNILIVMKKKGLSFTVKPDVLALTILQYCVASCNIEYEYEVDRASFSWLSMKNVVVLSLKYFTITWIMLSTCYGFRVMFLSVDLQLARSTLFSMLQLRNAILQDYLCKNIRFDCKENTTSFFMFFNLRYMATVFSRQRFSR